MKTKNFTIALLVTLIVIVPVNNGFSSNDNLETKLVYENSFQEINAAIFIIDIIEALEREAVYEEDKLLGWPARLNGASEIDERMFRGLHLGMAGIGDFLLNAYLLGYSESRDLLDDIIIHFVENAEPSYNGGVFWGRFSNEDTAGWLGLRYGNAGIISFLSRVENSKYNSSISKLIEDGFSYVKSLQLEDGSWPMTEDGYVTHGNEYGGVGVGNMLIELYQNTANRTYLNEARGIADHIINQGTWIGENFYIPWSPQEIGSEFDALIVYGIGAGLAGSMLFYLDIFEETNNPLYLETAEGLARAILEDDLGGYWLDGTVSYLSRIYDGNDALTGYYVGSSGIASSLNRIFDKTNEIQFLNASARAEKFVVQLLNEDFQLPIGLTYDSNHFTGVSMGSAGLAKLELQLYKLYGTSRHYEIAGNILFHLHQIMKSEGLIPVDESLEQLGYAFNLHDGLAGIGNVVLEYSQIITDIQVDDYEILFQDAKPNSEFSVNSTKNSTSADSKIFEFYFIVILFSIIFKRKIKRDLLVNN